MKRLMAMGFCVVLLAASVGVYAEEGVDVTYVGGTAPGFKEGAAAKMDTTAPNELKLHAGAADCSASYAQMTRIEYREQNRFRLGPAATLVVGILKAREKVHTVTITWKDEHDTANVVRLEMPKRRAMSLLSVLSARAPGACFSGLSSGCTMAK